MLDVQPTAIPDVKIVTPKRFVDHRGFFSEVYSRRCFFEAGITEEFVQDNLSLSTAAGTVRGLHFQSHPFAQAKLVRVTRGRIMDVAVDIRRSSPSYGQHVAVELSSENGRQLLIPVGFAHGFCTLEADTEVQYKATAYYSAPHNHGIAFDDPALGIEWPVRSAQAILSDKDRKQPRLEELTVCFD
ncbi:dTDP-4-dehydrorhamnose 3,5-epimerase [Microvirga makkahensis]|uniref:dTDP-4-dehydrorhamnose 3,5-epimerase n=1 Tax=Microvirga makkahensis TaxID=1128670 RepID=A0A7X3SPV8_9HYPH|nr:dTDP-4-dehydrorhamnose 3,5-epimerase [Microvirga makkahensis]MXQ12906.1 dTDP-4-dehydrorhamnose 3,5-epimerase [Microvirga makkahensis]